MVHKQNKPWTRSTLVDHIWESLDCTEQQTRKVIAQFIEDIELFDKKQRDYGTKNIDKFGVLGVLVRVSDKIERLINLQKQSKKTKIGKIESNEPMMDSWADITVYGAIARIVSKGTWSKGS